MYVLIQSYSAALKEKCSDDYKVLGVYTDYECAKQGMGIAILNLSIFNSDNCYITTDSGEYWSILHLDGDEASPYWIKLCLHEVDVNKSDISKLSLLAKK